MPASSQTNKLISTLRLLIPRLRLLQKKDTASSVIQRRELASLLEENRHASARIRVENVIATDIGVEVMEMVELYCELLLARANVLDQIAFGEKGVRARGRVREVVRANASAGGAGAQQEEKRGIFGGFSFKSTPTPKPSTPSEDDSYMDSALDEAAVCIFYAWPRFPHDIRELTILRTLLGDRYGKDFMSLAQDNKVEGVSVPERLVKGLRVKAPGEELVESYLREIARAYRVDWPGEGGDEGDVPTEMEYPEPESETQGSQNAPVPHDNGQGQDSVGEDADHHPSTPNPNRLPRRPSDASELTKVTPPRGLQSGKSPVSVAPPAPRTDNPNPRVKLPGSDSQAEGQNEVGGGERGGERKRENKIPELDELTRRFAALKR